MNLLPKFLRILLTAMALLGLMDGSGQVRASNFESEPLQATKRHFGPLFSKIPAEMSGLSVRNSYDDPEMWGSRYQEFQGGAIGTGISVGDIDGDGWTDLFVVTKYGDNKLYRQVEPLKFEDITERAGVAGSSAWGTGASCADVENDGDLAMFLSLNRNCFLDTSTVMNRHQLPFVGVTDQLPKQIGKKAQI